VTTWVALVAPLIATPSRSQRYVTATFAGDHVPVEAVRRDPTTAVPETRGADFTTSLPGVTADVEADVVEADVYPGALAVTRTASRFPRSAGVTTYLEAVAPLIGEPSRNQR